MVYLDETGAMLTMEKTELGLKQTRLAMVEPLGDQ